MEKDKPSVNVIKVKPPAEPPPSSEKNKDLENRQWLNDIQDQANNELQSIRTAKIAILQEAQYQPKDCDQTEDEIIHQHLLKNIIQDTYRTKHPHINRMSIPTPKTTALPLNQYDCSNWMNNESIEWTQNEETKWTSNTWLNLL